MYLKTKREAGIQKTEEELKVLNYLPDDSLPAEETIYYSIIYNTLMGFFVFFFTGVFFLNAFYKYSQEKIFIAVLSFVFGIGFVFWLISIIKRSNNREPQVQMNDEYLIYRAEKIPWQKIESDSFHVSINSLECSLDFTADNNFYSINISELQIPRKRFKYLYYSYKLNSLKKTES